MHRRGSRDDRPLASPTDHGPTQQQREMQQQRDLHQQHIGASNHQQRMEQQREMQQQGMPRFQDARDGDLQVMKRRLNAIDTLDHKKYRPLDK